MIVANDRSQSAETAAALPRGYGERRGVGHAVGQFIRSQPIGAVSAIVVIGLALAALLAPVLAPYGQKSLVGPPFGHPDSRFLLGTDALGRDVLSRLLWGGRVSLTVGLAGSTVGVLGGMVLGILAGYAGGAADTIVERFVDGAQAIPPLVLALVLVAAFGASITIIVIAVAVVYVPITTRVVRVIVLSLKTRPYVEAARACGASSARILVQHIAVNTVPTVLVLFSLAVANGIVIEASLSFLGVGVPPNVASWGGMIQATKIQTLPLAPWTMFAPAAVIGIAVYAFNLLGDAVRDALDPKLRGG
jgi:peptide/nickel transport system permease protein